MNQHDALLVAPRPQESELFDTAFVSPEYLIASSAEARKTFDDFMWIYVGDPVLSKFPEIRRNHPLAGECNYGNRLMSYCYSQEGSLVHIRRSWGMHSDNHEADYFVATAQLAYRDSSVEWEVLRVDYARNRTDDGLKIDLLLRNGADTARLLLNNQDFIWFDSKTRMPEILMPGSELSRKLLLIDIQ